VRSGEVGARLGEVGAAAARADVWFACVGEHVDDLDRLAGALLSGDERQRLGRYRTRETAERYVVTRSLVRLVLGEHLGIAPREIRVSRTDTGKPIVAEGAHFNVTHSGDLVLVAVSADRAVGIDVERRRDVPRVDALVERWLTPFEREELLALMAGGDSLSDAFLRVWSLKEARLKALGVGISGAGGASFDAVEALALDDLLERLPNRKGRAASDYVGALAFA
jgi:4'-phosphopantetheinyl transferase